LSYDDLKVTSSNVTLLGHQTFEEHSVIESEISCDSNVDRQLATSSGQVPDICSNTTSTNEPENMPVIILDSQVVPANGNASIIATDKSQGIVNDLPHFQNYQPVQGPIKSLPMKHEENGYEQHELGTRDTICKEETTTSNMLDDIHSDSSDDELCKSQDRSSTGSLFNCPLCDETTSSALDITCHINQKHMDIVNPAYQRLNDIRNQSHGLVSAPSAECAFKNIDIYCQRQYNARCNDEMSVAFSPQSSAYNIAANNGRMTTNNNSVSVICNVNSDVTTHSTSITLTTTMPAYITLATTTPKTASPTMQTMNVPIARHAAPEISMLRIAMPDSDTQDASIDATSIPRDSLLMTTKPMINYVPDNLLSTTAPMSASTDDTVLFGSHLTSPTSLFSSPFVNDPPNVLGDTQVPEVHPDAVSNLSSTSTQPSFNAMVSDFCSFVDKSSFSNKTTSASGFNFASSACPSNQSFKGLPFSETVPKSINFIAASKSDVLSLDASNPSTKKKCKALSDVPVTGLIKNNFTYVPPACVCNVRHNNYVPLTSNCVLLKSQHGTSGVNIPWMCERREERKVCLTLLTYSTPPIMSTTITSSGIALQDEFTPPAIGLIHQQKFTGNTLSQFASF